MLQNPVIKKRSLQVHQQIIYFLFNRKVKISGYKGQKAAAEMLASMYDASLDQFKSHSWEALDIWDNYTNENKWEGTENFTSIQSIQKEFNEEYLKLKDKIYDALMSPG